MSSKGEIKRAKIIVVATEMLKEKNYSDIRGEEIAAAAGLAKSMIFYYFESKGMLYLEIFKNLREALYIEYEKEIQQVDNLNDEEQIEDLILKLTDIMLNKHNELVRLTIDIDSIYQECPREKIVKIKLEVERYEYSTAGLLAQKTNILTVREFAYIFSIVRFCVSGYYRIEMGNFKSAQKGKGYHYYEAKSICEYRIARLVRYFLTGMFASHGK